MMKSNPYSLLSGVSVAALLVAGAATAQQAGTANDIQADVLGGQVVVEQQDATVDVTIPEPEVNVTQAAPVVTVEQPQPEITVSVPEPTVTVQQQAPIITIEQAQPQVTVRIPEPIVTIQVPQPEVDVATGEPVIDLEQPEPVVRFVRPEPRITIEEAEPRVTVENAEPVINMEKTQEANVTLEQADPVVNVEQSQTANVEVLEAETDAQVNVTAAEAAQIEIDQRQARVVLEDFNMDEKGNMPDADRARYQETVADLPIFNMDRDELIGRSVATESGEDVGEIDFIGKRGDKLVAIIGVGGFLGMGENEVAIPLTQLVMARNEVIVPGYTEERLENMPEFNEAEVEIMGENMRLAEAVGLD